MMNDQSQERLIILPGDSEFSQTLGRSLPVGWQDDAGSLGGDFCLVCRHDKGGVMEVVSVKEATDYVWGGELDVVEELNEEYEQEYYVNAPDYMRF